MLATLCLSSRHEIHIAIRAAGACGRLASGQRCRVSGIRTVGADRYALRQSAHGEPRRQQHVELVQYPRDVMHRVGSVERREAAFR